MYNTKELLKGLGLLLAEEAGIVVNVLGEVATQGKVNIQIGNNGWNGIGLIGGPLVAFIAPFAGDYSDYISALGAGMFSEAIAGPIRNMISPSQTQTKPPYWAQEQNQYMTPSYWAQDDRHDVIHSQKKIKPIDRLP